MVQIEEIKAYGANKLEKEKQGRSIEKTAAPESAEESRRFWEQQELVAKRLMESRKKDIERIEEYATACYENHLNEIFVPRLVTGFSFILDEERKIRLVYNLKYARDYDPKDCEAFYKFGCDLDRFLLLFYNEIEMIIYG